MRIAIFSQKGGVGKSALAISLYDYFDDLIVVSDDKKGMANVYDFYYTLDSLRGVRHNGTIVYDMHRVPNENSLDIIEMCDVVVIPTLNDDPSALHELIHAAKRIEAVNTNIVFAIMAADSTITAQYVIMDNFLDKYPWVSIRASKGFMNAPWSGHTITQLQRTGGKEGTAYKNVVGDIKILSESIKAVAGKMFGQQAS